MKRRLLRVLLWAMAALVLALPAAAESLDLDLGQSGTIVLELKNESGEPVQEGVYWLIQVGTPVIRENNLCFDKTADFAGSAVSLDDLSKSDLAEALGAYAEGQDGLLKREKGPDETGRVVFSNVSCGLYLVMQAVPGEEAEYERMTAFVVSVPMTDEAGEGWTYDVTAMPKLLKKPEPTPTPPPKEPDLPQTGLPIWPIPVLGGAGLMLFVVGWALCVSGKKHV